MAARRRGARGGWRRGPARPRGRACRLPLARRAPPGGRGVLREEELILVAVVGGSALLILGILELIWPSTPRHPVRRPQPARAPPPTPTKTVTPARATAPAMPVRERRSQVSPHARPHAGSTDRVGERVPLPACVSPFPMERPAVPVLAVPVMELEAERLPEPVVAADAPDRRALGRRGPREAGARRRRRRQRGARIRARCGPRGRARDVPAGYRRALVQRRPGRAGACRGL